MTTLFHLNSNEPPPTPTSVHPPESLEVFNIVISLKQARPVAAFSIELVYWLRAWLTVVQTEIGTHAYEVGKWANDKGSSLAESAGLSLSCWLKLMLSYATLLLQILPLGLKWIRSSVSYLTTDIRVVSDVLISHLRKETGQSYIIDDISSFLSVNQSFISYDIPTSDPLQGYESIYCAVFSATKVKSARI